MEKLPNNEVFSPPLAWRAQYKVKNKIEMEWWSKGMEKADPFSSFNLGALFSSHPCYMCHLASPSLLALKTIGFLILWMCAQRACLAERELVTGRLADVDALSVRSDKDFARQAGCMLSALLSDFTFSRVLLTLLYIYILLYDNSQSCKTLIFIILDYGFSS